MEHKSEDIIQNINTQNRVEVTNELEKLWYRKRVALTSHFTRRKNILSHLIISTMSRATDPDEATNFNYSTTTREQLNQAKTELDKSYEKLKHLYDRVKELNPNNEHQLHTNSKQINLTIQTTENTYDKIEIQFGTLKYKLIHQQQQHQPQIAEAQFKLVTAYRPNFELLNLAKYNHTSYQHQKRQTGIHKHQHRSNMAIIAAKRTIFKKLKRESKCLGCEQHIHKPGITCPHETSLCQNCGIKISKHIQSVCATPKTPKQNTRHKTNYTFAKSPNEEQTTDSESD